MTAPPSPELRTSRPSPLSMPPAQMAPSRYSKSRQKVCKQCSSAKSRCLRTVGACSRCFERGLDCSYVDGCSKQDDLLVVPLGNDTQLDFANLALVCPINVDEIAIRWLNPYLPGPEQTVKDYPPRIADFIYRILKSYARSAVRGGGDLPFIHATQTKQAVLTSLEPLATCLSLVRSCLRPIAGSEEALTQVLLHEMVKLSDRCSRFSDMTLLAAYQAYLIYTMALVLQLRHVSAEVLRQSMTSLQELACATSRRGLICTAEQQRVRPTWEEWICVEAKRRTLYTMYLLDSVVATLQGLPTFLGTELKGLPAPGSKALWQAGSRQQWESLYNIHLSAWSDGGLCIDELWAMPPGMDEASVQIRRDRVDHWLEDLDEFGTMMYAATSCTHG